MEAIFTESTRFLITQGVLGVLLILAILANIYQYLQRDKALEKKDAAHEKDIEKRQADHEKEVAKQDERIKELLTSRSTAIEARDDRIQALHDARLLDNKNMLESRVADARESQRVSMESAATIGRLVPVIETLGETIREVAEAGRLQEGLAREREIQARRQGGAP